MLLSLLFNRTLYSIYRNILFSFCCISYILQLTGSKTRNNWMVCQVPHVPFKDNRFLHSIFTVSHFNRAKVSLTMFTNFHTKLDFNPLLPQLFSTDCIRWTHTSSSTAQQNNALSSMRLKIQAFTNVLVYSSDTLRKLSPLIH